MRQTTLNISLHDGIRAKMFAAEITGKLGQPLRGIEVLVHVDGACSLASDHHQDTVRAATDDLGRVVIALNRPPGQTGDIEGRLDVTCPIDDAAVHMRFLAMTADARRRA